MLATVCPGGVRDWRDKDGGAGRRPRFALHRGQLPPTCMLGCRSCIIRPALVVTETDRVCRLPPPLTPATAPAALPVPARQAPARVPRSEI